MVNKSKLIGVSVSCVDTVEAERRSIEFDECVMWLFDHGYSIKEAGEIASRAAYYKYHYVPPPWEEQRKIKAIFRCPTCGKVE
jgi:hypothetical protein